MKSEPRKKIAYLFGAGATHAELIALNPYLPEKQEKEGLLIRHVSSRVISKASADIDYVRNLQTVSGTSGSLNIELLISLIENSKVEGWSSKSALLKNLVEEDIKAILTRSKLRRFYLHRALFQFHQHRTTLLKEDIVGLISLNYDDVLDRAYKQYCGNPNYCFTLDNMLSRNIPLLKLHGSFNWNDTRIRKRRRAIEIIPLGAAKSYLHAPYTFIWNRALEVLIKCDTLRIIGCSLSSNDVHLIELLFKAHLERQDSFDIEIIASDNVGNNIRNNYGFFPNIKSLVEIENTLIPERDPPNPFETWLKYKSLKTLGLKRIKRLNYLRKVLN